MTHKNYSWIPNSITLARAAIAVSIGVLVFVPHSISAVQILAVVGILSDKIDGTLARLLHSESELGKKLESIVDPFFNLCLGVYIVITLPFPVAAFWLGVTLLGITIIGRTIVRARTHTFFYEKSAFTRYGTLTIYVVGVLYLFAIPYREWAVWLACIYGCMNTANYLRMILRRLKSV